MSFFQAVAYLAPLIAGFGVAAALALTWDRPVGRRFAVAGGVVGGLAVILLLAGVTRLSAAGPALVLVVTFALLVAAAFFLCASFRLPPAACQVVSGLVVVLLVGTVFIAGPAVEQDVARGMDSDGISRRIGLALAVNPFMVMGYSVFETPLLHDTSLYSLGLADYQFPTPAWGRTSLGYLAAAAVMVVLAAGVSRLTRARLT